MTRNILTLPIFALLLGLLSGYLYSAFGQEPASYNLDEIVPNPTLTLLVRVKTKTSLSADWKYMEDELTIEIGTHTAGFYTAELLLVTPEEL